MELEFNTAAEMLKQNLMKELMKHDFETIRKLHRKLIPLKECSANPTEENLEYTKSNMCRDLIKKYLFSNNIIVYHKIKSMPVIQ